MLKTISAKTSAQNAQKWSYKKIRHMADFAQPLRKVRFSTSHNSAIIKHLPRVNLTCWTRLAQKRVLKMPRCDLRKKSELTQIFCDGHRRKVRFSWSHHSAITNHHPRAYLMCWKRLAQKRVLKMPRSGRKKKILQLADLEPSWLPGQIFKTS